VYESVKAGYVNGISPLSRGESRTFRLIDLKDQPNALNDPTIMKDFGTDGLVYVFQHFQPTSHLPPDPLDRDGAITKLGGRHRKVEVQLMNETPAPKNDNTSEKYNPEVQHYLATVEDIVNIALNPDVGAAVNSLDLRLDGGAPVVVPSDFMAHGQEAFYETATLPFVIKSQFPLEWSQWALYSTGNTFHSGHVDSNGACTMLVTNSPKIFFVPIPDPLDNVGASVQGTRFQLHSSQTFESIYNNPFVGGDTWHWEAFVIQPGQLLYVILVLLPRISDILHRLLPPRVFHCVTTPHTCMAIGGHFYSWGAIFATICSIYETCVLGNLTNNDHQESWEILCRMGLHLANRLGERLRSPGHKFVSETCKWF
jgi:hypothetical protein